MRYETVKDLTPAESKRLTGVKPGVFAEMLGVMREAEMEKLKAGRSSKLSSEDQLLLALSYWREYRTQFHIAASYEVHESTANRIINRVEDLLIASGKFTLSFRNPSWPISGRKLRVKFSLPKRRTVEETAWTVVLIDVTETPVERPNELGRRLPSQKSRSVTTAARNGVMP